MTGHPSKGALAETHPTARFSGMPRAIAVRFQLKLSRSCCLSQSIAEALPRLRVDIERFLPASDGRAIEDLHIYGNLDPDEIVAKVVSEVGDIPMELLEVGAWHVLLRLVTPRCELLEAFQASSVIPVFPLSLRSTSTTFRVFGARSSVSGLYTRLKVINPSVTFSTRKKDLTADRRGLLTPKQLEVFRFAREVGYWDTPRRITLTDMAFLLDMSKSALSEALATVERKIIQEGLNHALTP